MSKKYTALSIIVLSIFIFSIIIAVSETNIVDSMQFQGDGLELTYEKAVTAAMEGNPAVAAARKNLEQAEVSFKKNKSEIDRVEVHFQEMKDDPSTNLLYVKSPSYKRDVALPLLNLNYSVDNAQRELNATIAGVKATIEQYYFSLLLASRRCEIQKENMDISEEMYKKLQKKHSLGLIAKQELLNSEISNINAKTSYEAALSSYSKAKMALNNTLGYGIMNEMVLKDELEHKEFKLDSIAEAIKQAFSNRIEIKSLEYACNLENLNLEITLLQYPEITYIYQEQKIKRDKALHNLEVVKKNIELEIRSTYLDIMQKQEEIKAGEKSVELAAEAFKLGQATYDAGLGLQTDVQKAQLSMLQSKLGLAQTILDYNLAVSKFNDSISVGRK